MVILSMAAYFSGVVQAPLTALVIVTEMTGNRSGRTRFSERIHGLCGTTRNRPFCSRDVWIEAAYVCCNRGRLSGHLSHTMQFIGTVPGLRCDIPLNRELK